MLINICVLLTKIRYIILENVKYKEKLFILGEYPAVHAVQVVPPVYI